MTCSTELRCHPGAPAAAVQRIAVQVDRTATGRLALAFVLEGDLGRLRVPAAGTPRRGHDLWRHTCFEAFVALEAAPGYHELNFSPAREWAVLAFRGYRQGGPVAAPAWAPEIAVRADRSRLELDASVPLDRLSVAHARAVLHLGLAAVVEDTDGTLSYWALDHPAPAPDFHHADAFALRLEPPGGAC